jgi:hypothetical protein
MSVARIVAGFGGQVQAAVETNHDIVVLYADVRSYGQTLAD